MKILLPVFYIISGLLLFSGIFGGTVTEPLVENISENIISSMGVDVTRIDSIDAEIDLSIHTINMVLLKLENIKKIITFEDIEIKQLPFKKNKYMRGLVYDPIVSAVSGIVRIVMTVTGLILMCLTVATHAITSYFDLRKRVRILEAKIQGINQGIQTRM